MRAKHNQLIEFASETAGCPSLASDRDSKTPHYVRLFPNNPHPYITPKAYLYLATKRVRITQDQNVRWKLLAIRAGYIRLGLMSKY
jgi:hypothetical protein